MFNPHHPSPPSARHHHQGTSLLLTLVVMAGILILVVVMARVVIIERRVSHSYSDVLRAQSAAQAGAEDARQQLLQLFSKYPNACTYWAANIGSSTTPGTVYMYRALPGPITTGTGIVSGTSVTPETEAFDSRGRSTADIFVQPLISGGKLQDMNAVSLYNSTASEWAKCDQMLLPADVTGTNSVDLNTSAYDGDANGWIGKLWNPVTQQMETRPVRVPWVNMTDDKGNLVGRYAFWVEDESFRVNVNTAQPGTRIATTGTTQGLGYTPNDVSLRGVFSPTDTRGDMAQAVATARGNLAGNGYLSNLQVSHATTAAPTLGQDNKSLTTVYSSTDELSRSATKRLNINKLVALSNPPSDGSGPADATAVTRTLQQIIQAIKYHSPNFGQRFYRKTTNLDSLTDVPVNTTTILSSYSDIYLWKIAGNIRDYICPDSQPTIVKIVNNIPTVQLGKQPTEAIQPPGGNNIYQGQNPYIVQGKKNIPYLSEYVLKAALLGQSDFPYSGKFQVMIDHYMKFWNLTNKDIHVSDLGPHPFIRIMNQPALGVGTVTPAIPGGDTSTSRDFDIPLDQLSKSSSGDPESDIIFPAGCMTIISTDPSCLASDSTKPWIMLSDDSSTTVYYAPVLYFAGTTTRADSSSSPYPSSVRYYTGITKDTNDVPPGNGCRIKMANRTAEFQDAATKFIMGNDYGLLDSEASLLIERQGGGSSASPVVLDWDTTDREDPAQNFYRGGVVQAQVDASTYIPGDPRAKNEQMQMIFNSTNYGAGQTRLTNDGLNDDNAPGNCKIGDFNYNLLTTSGSTGWNDPFLKSLKATSAPAVMANQPMQSIGELGHIYDPVRKAPTSTPTVEYQYGGGRTFRIGQPDELISKRMGPSWNWASWRLCDMFTAQNDFSTPGKVNINGIARDNGQAVLASVFAGAPQDANGNIDVTNGFQFLGTQPAPQHGNTSNPSDPAVPSDERFANATYSPAGTQAIHDLLMTRLGCIPGQNKFTDFDPVANGPFWERGELSQLALFNSATLTSSATSMTLANDRAREEIFRRAAELITTRGSVYTAYVVGQACKQIYGPNSPAPPTVLSTSALKITFRVTPIWNPVLDDTADNFDPTDATAVAKRFRQPDHYETEILSVSYQ